MLAERTKKPPAELVSLEGRTAPLVTQAFAHAFVRIANGLHVLLFLIPLMIALI